MVGVVFLVVASTEEDIAADGSWCDGMTVNEETWGDDEEQSKATTATAMAARHLALIEDDNIMFLSYLDGLLCYCMRDVLLGRYLPNNQ